MALCLGEARHAGDRLGIEGRDWPRSFPARARKLCAATQPKRRPGPGRIVSEFATRTGGRMAERVTRCAEIWPACGYRPWWGEARRCFRGRRPGDS